MVPRGFRDRRNNSPTFWKTRNSADSTADSQRREPCPRGSATLDTLPLMAAIRAPRVHGLRRQSLRTFFVHLRAVEADPNVIDFGPRVPEPDAFLEIAGAIEHRPRDYP